MRTKNCPLFLFAMLPGLNWRPDKRRINRHVFWNRTLAEALLARRLAYPGADQKLSAFSLLGHGHPTTNALFSSQLVLKLQKPDRFPLWYVRRSEFSSICVRVVVIDSWTHPLLTVTNTTSGTLLWVKADLENPRVFCDRTTDALNAGCSDSPHIVKFHARAEPSTDSTQARERDATA
jgi:hypothetical protein